MRKLVRNFQNPQIGVVAGDVRPLPFEDKFGAGQGMCCKNSKLAFPCSILLLVDGLGLIKGVQEAPGTDCLSKNS